MIDKETMDLIMRIINAKQPTIDEILDEMMENDETGRAIFNVYNVITEEESDSHKHYNNVWNTMMDLNPYVLEEVYKQLEEDIAQYSQWIKDNDCDKDTAERALLKAMQLARDIAAIQMMPF